MRPPAPRGTRLHVRRAARRHLGRRLALAFSLGASLPLAASSRDAQEPLPGLPGEPAPASSEAPAAWSMLAGAPTPSTGRRVLGTLGAIFPGALVHGTGHYILGRPKTGTLLVVMEGIGVLTLAGSVAVLALTGASRDIVGPNIVMAIGGGALFSVSWLADIYGTAVPESARGVAPAIKPFLVTELGYRYIHDPQFRYRSFAALGVDARYDELRLLPSAWQSLDDDNGRYRLLAGYRFIGPVPASASRGPRLTMDGSFLDLELGATYHRYDSDGFRVLTGEAFASSRLDMARLDPELAGSFAEFGLGWALQRIDYGASSDTAPVLLGRFAFGAYLGDPSAVGGELSAYYDHRHDDFAAGLKLNGLGSGPIGHFGLDARWFIDERWGALLDVQAGSAVIIGASVVMRQGSLP